MFLNSFSSRLEMQAFLSFSLLCLRLSPNLEHLLARQQRVNGQKAYLISYWKMLHLEYSLIRNIQIQYCVYITYIEF